MSAYVGSSNNLKDLKNQSTTKAPKHQRTFDRRSSRRIQHDSTVYRLSDGAGDDALALGRISRAEGERLRVEG